MRSDDDFVGLMSGVVCCSGSKPTQQPRLARDRDYWPLSDESLYSVVFVCNLE